MSDAAWLRSLPVLSGDAPGFHVEHLPGDPIALFRNWLAVAAERGVSEPHAMTLATVDAEGFPDARTLILKDIDERGWAFAGHRHSAKGIQIAARPAAALTFWWQPLVRAVRVRGSVVEATREESAADLAARSAAARAGIRPEDWVLWRVAPEQVEFWQGRPDREHLRVMYRREGNGWGHRMLPADPIVSPTSVHADAGER